jgi:hypothetical protein
MRSEQARSTEAAPTPSTWIGKVDLNASVARMVHRLVLTVGGTGIGGLGDPFLAAVPLPVSSSARPGEPGSTVVGDHRRSDRTHPFWVMLPRPPHGTMRRPRPTANASAEAKGDTLWLGPRRRRWTSFAG